MTEFSTREPVDRHTRDLMVMIDYLDKDVRSISPTGAHFLQMAKVALANPHWDRASAAAGRSQPRGAARHDDDAGE